MARRPSALLLSVLLLSLLLSPAHSGTYSTSQALNQLYLSYAAYCPQAAIQSWTCHFCGNVPNFQVVTTFYDSTTNILGYVGYSNGVGHVIFRGTQSNSLVNWIADLSAAVLGAYSNIPGGEVHAGFLAAWLSVKPLVVSGVQELITNHHPTFIYFSGHSLGAALSLFAALEIGETLSIPYTVYNFGEPRVGNEDFAKWFDGNIGDIWRVTNQADPVPHLPTEKMGFYHVATEVWYKTATTIKICDNSGEDSTCSDSVLLPINTNNHLDYLGITLNDGGGCS